MFNKNSHYTRALYWTVELLLLALLVLVLTKLDFIYSPIGKFISTIFVPLIIAGFLFYLLNPIVGQLTKIKIGSYQVSRNLAIAVAMIVTFTLIIVLLINILPDLLTQIGRLLSALPNLAKDLQDVMQQMVHSEWFKNSGIKLNVDDLQKTVSNYTAGFLKGTANTLGGTLSKLTTVTINTITIPIMLFYMLRDGRKLLPFILQFFSEHHQSRISDLSVRVSNTISHYVSGTMIDAVIVGCLTGLGYALINQPFALLLAVIAGVSNIVPYLGPYIGLLPAAVVAITVSPQQLIMTILVVAVVHLIDGNLLYPNIIGKSLQIHPLTIIVLLLAAGNIAGFMGMILIVPCYAIFKTLAEYSWQIYQIRKQSESEEKPTKTKRTPKRKTTIKINHH